MNRILVTGANGFIGRHCTRLLAGKGYEVHAVSRRPEPMTELPNVVWHKCDLLQPGYPTKLIREVRPQSVLHLAWYAIPGKFWDARENVDWVRASLELLSAFADNGGKRIVAAGTCAEYDLRAGECIENVTPASPTTLYGTSKNAVERVLRDSRKQTGLSSAWGRVFFPYGPNEHPSRIVAYAVRSLLRGEPALCSEGTDVLDFIYVEDAASAFVALLESDVQGPVNIASGRRVAVRDLLREIGTQLKRPDLIRLGERESSSGVSNIWANVERLKNAVGWKPHFDLPAGIQQTIQWWRNSSEFFANAPATRP